MNTTAEQLDWFVGLPTGARTRVCYNSPNGVHLLTPEPVRKRYLAEVSNSGLVVWHLRERNIGGIRAGIDEVAWNDADIAYFETSFCRPAKGSGYVLLEAHCRSGRSFSILYSDRYNSVIHEWHLAAASLLDHIYPGFTRQRDDGFDA